jgi:hypothetical protein
MICLIYLDKRVPLPHQLVAVRATTGAGAGGRHRLTLEEGVGCVKGGVHRHCPQGLKPRALDSFYGGAEAPPLQGFRPAENRSFKT